MSWIRKSGDEASSPKFLNPLQMPGVNVYFDPFSSTLFHIYCLKPGHPNENVVRWEKNIPCTKKSAHFQMRFMLNFH